MSLIDCFEHEVVGSLGVLNVYLSLEDISSDELVCPSGSLVVGGGSGEFSANSLPLSDAIVAAVEFEIFSSSDSGRFDREFESYLDCRGLLGSCSFEDFDYSPVCELDYRWSPVFSGDEWYELGAFARGCSSYSQYVNIEHWIMVNAARLYIRKHSITDILSSLTRVGWLNNCCVEGVKYAVDSIVSRD